MMMYKMLIRAITDYGIMVYFPELESQRDKLEKVQFQGLRTAMGYRIGIPLKM